MLSVTLRQHLHCLLRLSLVKPMARGASCSIRNHMHHMGSRSKLTSVHAILTLTISSPSSMSLLASKCCPLTSV